MSETKTIIVQDLNVQPPANVDFTMSTANPIVGKEITFTGSATAPANGPITSWQWHFGDGPTKSGQTVTHTFATAGEWKVSLVASNAGGATPTTVLE